LYPFELQLIEQRLLTPSEIAWLNQYHERVGQRILPRLSGEVAEWFAGKCKTLSWND
jgi:Xaa-Pro aminopeptidase